MFKLVAFYVTLQKRYHYSMFFSNKENWAYNSKNKEGKKKTHSNYNMKV